MKIRMYNADPYMVICNLNVSELQSILTPMNIRYKLDWIYGADIGPCFVTPINTGHLIWIHAEVLEWADCNGHYVVDKYETY